MNNFKSLSAFWKAVSRQVDLLKKDGRSVLYTQESGCANIFVKDIKVQLVIDYVDLESDAMSIVVFYNNEVVLDELAYASEVNQLKGIIYDALEDVQ